MSELTIYMVSRKEDLDRLISHLNKKNFETKKCAICGVKIYNFNSDREPNNFFEKFLSFFGKKFIKWNTNFSTVSYNPNGVVCDDLDCFNRAGLNRVGIKI